MGESITMSFNRGWLFGGVTSFNGKIGLTLLFLLLALPAFAAGGTCPSGANYTNPANPTGALVTLSSLGVNSCYYVSANGSDTNNGTSKSSPFLHSPGMQTCASNCASVTLAPGIGVIFRGGDTWHFGNSSASPYAGVASKCANNGTVAAGLCLDDINGTSSNPVYYGVDPSWYTGGSWTRPGISADNSFCNGSTVGTMPDGATCTGATGSACLSSGDSYYNQPCYYVSSCPYQIGSSNNLVDVGFSKYITLDNFELSGLCENHVDQPEGDDTYIRYGSANAPLIFENLYIHGASHLQFYDHNNGSFGCPGGGSQVCINMVAFRGSVTSTTTGETIVENVVDFADSDPGGQLLCVAGFWNAAYNVFRYTTSCIPNPLHTFHDNLYEYFFENGHSNMLEDIGESTLGANAIYNNVFRHVETTVTSGGSVGLWFAPPTSGTVDYIFNNVMYDVGAFEYINLGGTAGDNAKGTYQFFNNTFQSNASQPILRCHLYTNGPVIDTNNHYIDDQSYILGPCSTLTTTTALFQTNAQADANVSRHFDQYTASETNGYSPVASSNSTVAAGTNEYSGYCSALATAGLSAAATACQSDMSYACSYAGNGAPPVCPARTVTARPTTAAWDIGAYEYNSQDPPPNPPTGLSAVVN